MKQKEDFTSIRIDTLLRKTKKLWWVHI